MEADVAVGEPVDVEARVVDPAVVMAAEQLALVEVRAPATALSEERTSVAAATIGCVTTSVTAGLLSTTVCTRTRA